MRNGTLIKVLLVDDSPIALVQLKRMLASALDIEVVGTAENGKEALELIPRLQPTVICTDLHMPVMDGLEFTREVMAKYPRPILVISVSVEKGSANVFTLIEAGAVDVFTKPRGGLDSEIETLTPQLINKIRVIAGVHVFRKFRKDIPAASPQAAGPSVGDRQRPVRIIVIGASTGGPQALQEILTALPADFRLPVVCVQHITEGFLDGLVAWLSSLCSMKVRIARPGELPQSGTVYFPPEKTHLKFDDHGRFVASTELPLDGHRPAVTITMQSAAKFFGSAMVSVLLTGMGRDGAEGMKAVTQQGGITIAQDEASCVIFGMPQEAIKLGAAKYVMPLNDIAGALMKIQNKESVAWNTEETL